MSASRRRLAPGARDDVTLPPNRAIYDGPRVDTWSGADAGVEPRIVVEDAGDNDTTLVRCQGFDRTGQLAALTIALSSFGLQIKSTFIRTDNDAPNVDDLFYVQNREGEPVSPSQHAALVAHMERALGLAPTAADNVAAARDAGFIPDRERAHVQGGGYDEDSQNAARAAAGGFFDDSSGDSLFDPEAYHSYGSNRGSGASSGDEFRDVPHGPEVPDSSFFDAPPGTAQDGPMAYGASEGAAASGFFGDDRGDVAPAETTRDDSWNGGQGFSDSWSAPAAAETQTQTQSWTNTSDDVASRGNSNAFDWGGSAESTREREPATDFAGDDAAAILSAQLRAAAADMAAAAAEFVALERDRAAARDAGEIERLAQPRLEAQESLSRTMSQMQSMLKERDAMRMRAMGIEPDPEPAAYTPSVQPPPEPAWPEARAYTAPPPPKPYEPPTPPPSLTPRPYQSWTPPEPVSVPEFEAPYSKFEPEVSFDEEDFPAPPMPPLDEPLPPPKTPMGSGDVILLQGFNWESCNSHEKWFNVVANEAGQIRDAGFNAVWLPPPTDSVSDQGYLPRDLYNLNSFYGAEGDLRRCVQVMKDHDICPVADIVINHRCAGRQDESGRWNLFSGRMAWDQQAITTDNPEFGGRGNPGTGEDYGPAPNIDHTKDWVRGDLKEWLHWMKNDIGFGGWRFDFVKGYGGQFTGEYVGDTQPFVSVGEHWVSCNYSGANLEYNQDSHRQTTFDWCKSTGGNTAAFDFTTKGILQEAARNREYWRLQGSDGHPSGFCGRWPTHAVTFLENHDTGSTLQHWPFPTDRLAEGYAYILTHPGTPTVFYDHWKDGGLREDIHALIDIRRRNGIKCNAAVHIVKAEDGCYSAHVGQPRYHVEEGCCGEVDTSQPSICVKLGPGDWSPNRDKVANTKWKVAASGHGWAVWEDKRFL